MKLSELTENKPNFTEIDKINFEKEYDVIVCGMGTAGSLAALLMAQNGLSVLGVDILSCVGGNHTAGGVIGHYYGTRGGRYMEMEEKVTEFHNRYTVSPAESRKLLLEKELCDNGVELMYETFACGVYMENNAVKGIKTVNDNGVKSFGAKVVLDCTADAYIAAMANCPTEMGRESDGQMQPYSVVSLMCDKGNYHYTNIDFGRMNQLDEDEFSRAVLFSRSYKIKEDHEGKEFIAQMPILGVREGRRIISEEVVTIEDLFNNKQTETPIYYSYADLDKHGWDIAFDGEILGDWAIGANVGAYYVTIAIGYKAILPKNVEGLLVPCRGVGVDRDIASCVRMNPDMKKLAEAAAVWATLAVKEGKALREVNYEEIKKCLNESGCLKDCDNRPCRIDGVVNWDLTPLVPADVYWIETKEDFKAVLKTEKPGVAIWSAKLMGEKCKDMLLPFLTSQDENERKHASFCLAMIGEKDGVDILREMVYSRDNLMLKDCRKNNNLRGCMAIYWLGRLGDAEITDELINLICDKKEIEKDLYNKNVQTIRYKVIDFEDVYFQFMSQAVMALVRIGDVHKTIRNKITTAFVYAFGDGTFYDRLTKRPKESSEGNMVLAIKNIAFSAIKKWEN